MLEKTIFSRKYYAIVHYMTALRVSHSSDICTFDLLMMQSTLPVGPGNLLLAEVALALQRACTSTSQALIQQLEATITRHRP